MKNIPESMLSQTGYKRRYTFPELYRAYLFVPGAMAILMRNRRKKLLDNRFVERLQLAVTEVNGCPACSYAHTRMALRQGMSNEEISSFLNGDGAFIRPEEAKAILFAQHFAESRGFPDKDAWDALVGEYGLTKAKIVLAAVQVMMVGNIYGLPFSAFVSRLKGKPYQNSSPGYELWMQTAGLLCFPIAFVHALLRWLAGKPVVRPDKSIL